MELNENENVIGTWTLNYIPPAGGRYTGKLMVTDKRVLFDAKFNTSATGIVHELIIYTGDFGYLSIDKSKILKIEKSTSFFNKKVMITVDNALHTFHYGLMSVNKLYDAINKK